MFVKNIKTNDKKMKKKSFNFSVKKLFEEGLKSRNILTNDTYIEYAPHVLTIATPRNNDVMLDMFGCHPFNS